MTTGLHQYIREQEHRNDLVGELARWMVKHYGERPDHSSLAFELAAMEYSGCGNWTRKAALERVNQNKEFYEILKIEPRLNSIVSEIIKTKVTKDYSFSREYQRFKAKINDLVGF